jgi:hypothetical protein
MQVLGTILLVFYQFKEHAAEAPTIDQLIVTRSVQKNLGCSVKLSLDPGRVIFEQRRHYVCRTSKGGLNELSLAHLARFCEAEVAELDG